MLTALTFLAAATASPAMVKPQISPMPSFTNADCANEQTRNAKMAEINGLGDREIKAWDDYFDARLTQLGMSKSEKEDFLDEARDSDEYVKLQGQLEGQLGSFTGELAAADRIEDEKLSCEAFVKFYPRMIPLRETSLQLMNVIDKRINAEAKRRGIKLN